MKKRKWWILAAVLWMLTIFTFTQLPFSTGENTSEVIHKVVGTEHPSLDSANDADGQIDLLNLMVRKTTHILVFGFLAFLLFKSLEVYRFSYLFSWVLTILYAMSDEYHQSFMPGRTASIKDVFLFDSVGAFVFLLVTFFIVRKNRRRLKQN